MNQSYAITTIRVAKITSTVGLGLVTAFLPSLPLITLPRLHSLPTPSAVSQELSSPKAQQHLVTVSTLGVDALLLISYFSSTSRARHPYILYTAGLSLFASLNHLYNVVPKLERIQKAGKEINGEQLSSELDDIGHATWVSAGLTATAFVLSLIGNIGDRY